MPYRVKCFFHIQRNCCRCPTFFSCHSDLLCQAVDMFRGFFLLQICPLVLVKEAYFSEMTMHSPGYDFLKQFTHGAEEADWPIVCHYLLIFVRLRKHNADGSFPSLWKISERQTGCVQIRQK